MSNVDVILQIQTIIEKLRHSPSNNYSTVSEHYFCRICHEGSDTSFGESGEGGVEVEPLISPCKCSGSVGLIHRYRHTQVPSYTGAQRDVWESKHHWCLT